MVGRWLGGDWDAGGRCGGVAGGYRICEGGDIAMVDSLAELAWMAHVRHTLDSSIFLYTPYLCRIWALQVSSTIGL